MLTKYGTSTTKNISTQSSQMTYMSVKLDFPYYKDDTLEIFSLPYEHDQLNEEISEAHMFLMRWLSFSKYFFDNQTRPLFSQAESRGWSCIWGARANFCLVGLRGDLPKDGDHQRWARAAQDEVGLLRKSQTCSPGHWWAGAKNDFLKIVFFRMTDEDFPFLGIHKLFSGETSKDFSPLTSQWEDFVLDTLQHKAVLKVWINVLAVLKIWMAMNNL